MKIAFKPFDEATQNEIIRLHNLGYGSSSIPLHMKDWPKGAPTGSRVYMFLKSKNLTREPRLARALGCRLRGIRTRELNGT